VAGYLCSSTKHPAPYIFLGDSPASGSNPEFFLLPDVPPLFLPKPWPFKLTGPDNAQDIISAKVLLEFTLSAIHTPLALSQGVHGLGKNRGGTSGRRKNSGLEPDAGESPRKM